MKWTKWSLKVSLTAILVSTLTIVTTGIVVNAYIQSVLSSFNIQLETEPMGVGGIMKSMLGMGSGTKPDVGSVNPAVDNNRAEDKDATSDEPTPGAAWIVMEGHKRMTKRIRTRRERRVSRQLMKRHLTIPCR